MTIQSLTSKLHRQQLSRAKLASKLHDLIESQWREALKIVTANGGSPINGMSSPFLIYKSPTLLK